MSRFDGSLALALIFGPTTTTSTLSVRPVRRDLQFAPVEPRRHPDKYAALEHQRRQAQIHARRQMDLLDQRRPDLKLGRQLAKVGRQ
jgi:hypothetical protein